MDFKNFQNRNLLEANFRKFDNSYIPSMGSREVLQKMWFHSVQPFWRLLDTNKQTVKKSIYIILAEGPGLACEIFFLN